MSFEPGTTRLLDCELRLKSLSKANIELRELNAELLTAMQDFISNVKRQKVAGYGDSEVQFDASFKEMERALAKAEKLK